MPAGKPPFPIYPSTPPAALDSMVIDPTLGVDIHDRDVWARSLVKARDRAKKATPAAVDLEKLITNISITDTMEGSSTIVISIEDQDWWLTDEIGFFDANADGKLDIIDCRYPPDSTLWWRCTQVSLSTNRAGASIDMTFMERVAVELLGLRGPMKVSRRKKTRAQFIRQLVDKASDRYGKIIFHSRQELRRQEVEGDTPSSGPATVPGGRILYVGDSLGVGTVGMGGFKNLAKHHFAVDAVVVGGKGSKWGAEQVDTHLRGNHYAVIFDMGTNDGNNWDTVTLQAFQHVLDLVKPRRMIVATLNGNTSSPAQLMNDDLPAWADVNNVFVVPWRQVSHDNGYVNGDPIHPGAAGYRARAHLFFDLVPEKLPRGSGTPTAGNSPSDSNDTGADGSKHKNKGITAAEGRTVGLTTADQVRNANISLQVADRLNPPAAAVQALICAGIVESGFSSFLTSSKGAKGCYQLMPSWWSQIDWRDTKGQAEYFLQHGFAARGSGISLAKQGKSPGEIAWLVENPGLADGPHTYGAPLDRAQRIIHAYGGVNGQTGNTDFSGGNNDGGGGSTYRKRFNFEVGGPDHPRETYWDAMVRLAGDVGWAMFVDGQNVYYDPETSLISQKPAAVVHRLDPAVVSFDATWDARQIATEATLELVCDPFQFRAGEVLVLRGFGPMSTGSTANLPGRWLIEEINRERFEPLSTLTLKQPDKPSPEPAADLVESQHPSSSSRGGGGGGGRIVDDAIKGSPIPGQPPAKRATHETGGLPGYPAFDYMAPAGTPVVAPYDGKIRKLSGRDPRLGGPPGGPLGYSIYLAGNGNDYYLTHLDKVLVKVGQRVAQGEQIAQVANGPPSWSSPHCHMGTHRGSV